MTLKSSILNTLRWLKLVKPEAKSESASRRQGRSYLETNHQSSRIEISPADRQELVRKSRHWIENSDILNQLCDIFTTYTVGGGLVVKPSSSTPKWNEVAQRVWDDWCRHPLVNGDMNFAAVQRLVSREWFIDGDILPIKSETNIRGRSYPRIQLIRSHRIVTPNIRDRRIDPRSIHDGVEVDSYGRPIAYWVIDEMVDGGTKYNARRIPADAARLVFEPEYSDQLRGLPMAYSVLDEIHDRADLQLLEMKAARDAASITNVWKNEKGEIPLEVLRRSAFSQTVTNNDDSTATETRIKQINDSTGGRTIAMKPNEDLTQMRSDRPSVVTMEYWRHLEEKICAGVGIPRILCYQDSVQGTVYRGILETAAARFRARSMVIANFCRWVYDFVITSEMGRNKALADLPGDWRNVSIRPPRAPNVDVGRNAQAEIASLAAGTTNLELIYGPLGLDWQEQIDKLAEQIEYAKSKGIDLPSMLASNPQSGQQSPSTRKEINATALV